MVLNDMGHLVIDLTDGSMVKLREVWVCADDCEDSHSEVEVTDCESGEVLCSYWGEIPDIEDDDFNIMGLVKLVENEIENA